MESIQTKEGSLAQIARDFNRKDYYFYQKGSNDFLDFTLTSEVAVTEMVKALAKGEDTKKHPPLKLLDVLYNAGYELIKTEISPEEGRVKSKLPPLKLEEARWLYSTKELFSLPECEALMGTAEEHMAGCYQLDKQVFTECTDGEVLGTLKEEGALQLVQLMKEVGDMKEGVISLFDFLDFLEEAGFLFYSKDFFTEKLGLNVESICEIRCNENGLISY